MFIHATSKKGIPAQIVQTQLPIINAEIAKILQGVVDFTLKFEKDIDSNSTEVFIDYGDSRRLVELGSGMEKMISSLAIRVALLNASSLPRPDFLVIDEGFGTLDETNIEACNRLLVSLKRWFRNIIVISHIDGIKDIADSVIEITRPTEAKDSHVHLE
jgi:DNA repair protein SbcC/Rad50